MGRGALRVYETLIRRGWWLILVLLAAAAAYFGASLPDLQVAAGTSTLLNDDDPDLDFYERTRPLWGYDEYAIVCVAGRDWVSADGAATLARLVEDLKGLPHVDHVVSLLDVVLLRQEPGTAINLARLPTLGSDGLDFERAREELLQHTQASGNLISIDGRSSNVLVYLDVPEPLRHLDALRAKEAGGEVLDAEERAELRGLEDVASQATDEQTDRRVRMVESLRDVAAQWSAQLGEPVRLSGISVINTNLLEHLRHDLAVFGIVAVAFFVLTFLVIYMRPRFVLLPILTCLLPVAIVVGLMSRLDMRVTIITSSLPLLLFVLMLPYAVYFVERYRERRILHPDERGIASTVRAAPAILLPCLFSCLTTIAGFAALRTSHTRPVRDFSLMMVLGMAVGFVVVFLAIPSMSRLLPDLRLSTDVAQVRPRKILRLFAGLALRHPWPVVIGGVLLLVGGAWGATRLTTESKFTSYFRADSEIYRGLEYIDTHMGGTTPLEIQLRSPQEGYFLTPPGLAALEVVGGFFDRVPETGNLRSLATLVEELKKKNAKIATMLPLLVRLPQVQAVTREFATPTFDVARVLLRMRETAPTLKRREILHDLRLYLAARPELRDLDVHVTGVFVLYANMLDTLIQTQRETFLYVLGAIFLMLLALFRAFWLSLLVLATQVLPVTVVLGVMGWFGIPLDLVTVMIASIAMGVGIDASIQYTYRYLAECRQVADRQEALRRTHGTIGRAIWIATTVIVAGFCVLVLSDFKPSVWFGLLTAVAMLVSQVAALTILPALLLLTGQPRKERTGSV